MELVMRNPNGSASIEVSEAIFGAELKVGLIHQIVTAYQAAARSGTKAQKSRSDVSGGGIKPWRQKGTGHARAGTRSSPLWRTGGVTFAAQPRCYVQKVNRKMYRAALRSIFSELVRSERMIVVPEITVAEPKTKAMIALLKQYDVRDVLIVTEEFDINLYLASRNLPDVGVLTGYEVDPVSLIGFDHVLITEKAIRQIEERLS